MIKNKKKDLSPENKTPLSMAIRYLTHQPRSIHEMQAYLAKKGFKIAIISNTIEILLEKKYLDDVFFTKTYVESRVSYKPKSKFVLACELKRKGIEPTIIESVLKEYNDFDLALKALEKKMRQWEHLDYELYKKKFLNFLQYRGFNYDISLSLLNRLNQSGQKT